MDKFFSSENRRLGFILITMFLNFLGFSIIIPILPFLVGQYISDQSQIALYVGLLLSSYALCQFFAAPGLGTLSDKYGRRPILLVSLLGSVAGYLLLGIGGAIWVLFLGRVIDGLTGGNISTVFAYMADITSPKERGKYYGMLGAAGGFGFMLGPAIGGFSAIHHISTPLFLAAGVTALNLIWGYFVLPESLSTENRIPKLNLKHLNPFSQFSFVLSLDILKRLFFGCALFYLAFNAMYGNASVYMKDVFRWNATQIGILLFVVGVLDIFSQGFLVRKLLPKFGDLKVSIIGLVFSALGLALAAATSLLVSPVLLYGAVIILNIGDGLFEPSSTSLISNSVGPKLQGRIAGANQGMQSMARVLGPVSAAYIYRFWKGLPYASESVLVILALVVILRIARTSSI